MSSTLDMSSILLHAYELAEMIKQSREVQEYLARREALQQDREAQNLIARFKRKKAEFEEVAKVGWWHPDYREKDAELRQLWEELHRLEVVKAYKSAEDRVDKMLYHVSRTLARSVSHTIKVPRNDEDTATGCGGGCGGCGNGYRRCG
ncbi:MAG: hypothetical protein BAA01_06205 [Bacillus thermozeamaize]|uniref:YlbF family regulator n=1 Tax=Bacillus thermozeamaize TaxID=230954 RepID=A0A1Y3PFT3_9BACI|nr:MAG: hypothetical protein BAA01_06205 [Bacillus thermozeamaize]